MTSDRAYAPTYNNSWALVVGIDDYKAVSPLEHATDDAQAVAHVLAEQFGFEEARIRTLYNDEASREAISEAFLDYADSEVLADDRIIFFFAGHGYTRTGASGEIGFLIPHDGDPERLSTLLRWDDITKNADLIPAKHILFLMDACYGGLALTRATPEGSSRFLKDMLQRRGRQVLTAGKADEPVIDAGGPRPGHSVFTGHLLDALEGAAATQDGVLTANRVSSYVYEHVATDLDSRQTPHFGFLRGDGDLIFDLTPLEELDPVGERDSDLLIESSPPPEESEQQVVEKTKTYLSSGEHRIRLDDLITNELESLHSRLAPKNFPTDDPIDADAISERLGEYEEITTNIRNITVLLSKWANEDQRPLLNKLIVRVVDREVARSGKKGWLQLQRYPDMLTVYSGGVSCVANESFNNLAVLLNSRARTETRTGAKQRPVASVVSDACAGVTDEVFKELPGHERQFVPRSEHLFKRVQPVVEDILFLGREYERYFDRFEVFLALQSAHLAAEEGRTFWGPPGRFGYKHARSVRGADPYHELRTEADREREQWAPLQARLFNGSYEDFVACWENYEELLGKMRWW